MDERTRAQETFRSIAEDAVNEIYNSLDDLGAFSIHKSDLDEREIQEAFNAIQKAVDETKELYAQRKARVRFQFAHNKAKALSIAKAIGAETRKSTRGGKITSQHIGVYLDGELVSEHISQREAARATGIPQTTISRAVHDGKPIKEGIEFKRMD